MISILKIITSPSIGMTELAKNINQKKDLLLMLTNDLTQLQGKFSDTNLLNALRRRIKQIAHSDSYLKTIKNSVTLKCFNSCCLSWEEAFDALIEIENTNTSSWEKKQNKFLTTTELIDKANLLKDSSVVSQTELPLYLPQRLVNSPHPIVTQLAVHLPLLILCKETEHFLVNMHQVDFNNKALDSFFDISDITTMKEKSASDTPVVKEKKKGQNGGRKSILQKFLDIPIIATEFIKSSGYKAQEKRRESTITSCGISIQDVRDHLLKNVPGLKEHGISETSIRYLFQPVNKSRNSAKRYNAGIDASVPRKENSRRKDNVDAHYLCSRIKLRRELISMLDDECTVVSADSMNKIRYGANAVSRYHQIRKIYMNDDKPNYSDHDFPLPYKTIPDGIMILENDSGSSLFGKPEVINFDDVLNNSKVITNINRTDEVCKESQEKLKKILFRANFELGREVGIYELLASRITEISGVTLTSTELQESLFSEFEDCTSYKETVNLIKILETIALSKNLKILFYSNLSTVPTIIAPDPASLNIITFAVEILKSSFRYYHIKVIDKEIDIDAEHSETSTSDIIEETDKLGRKHVKYPHSGQAIVYLRNNFFHENTCLENINDLYLICRESVKKGKTSFTVISDGGPDYSPNSLKNELLYAKLWRKSGLDQITVTCNAAGWSTLNPIEHLWSVLSNALTSVELTSSFRDDNIPPCKDTSLNKVEKEEMNKKVLDQGTKEVAAYWGALTFDNHPVIPLPVPSSGRSQDEFKSAKDIYDFISTPLRDKCQFFEGRPPCTYCSERPVQCQKLLKHVIENKGMLEPTPAPNFEGHYMTFLEMITSKEKERFASPNEGLPSSKMGKCELCPSWNFSSLTEAQRHISILHRN